MSRQTPANPHHIVYVPKADPPARIATSGWKAATRVAAAGTSLAITAVNISSGAEDREDPFSGDYFTHTRNNIVFICSLIVFVAELNVLQHHLVGILFPDEYNHHHSHGHGHGHGHHHHDSPRIPCPKDVLDPDELASKSDLTTIKLARWVVTGSLAACNVAAVYALFRESADVAPFFGVTNPIGQRALTAMIGLLVSGRFAVRGIHALAIIWGKEEELVQRIIRRKNLPPTDGNKPSRKQQALFLITFSLTHIIEGCYYTQDIELKWLRALAVIGIFSARAFDHCNHSLDAPAHIRDWWKETNRCRFWGKALYATAAGIAHAGQAGAGAAHFWNKGETTVTNALVRGGVLAGTSIECVIGAFEGLEHFPDEAESIGLPGLC